MTHSVNLRTVLITGASGFIGTHVCKIFLAEGWRVIGIGRSPLHPPVSSYFQEVLPSDSLGKLLKLEKPELVVHLAGSASVPNSFNDPNHDFHENVVVAHSVLEALRTSSPGTRCFFISSAAVCGEPTDLPIPETAPTRPISPYGSHKLIAEQLFNEYAFHFRVQSVIFRIFSVYGPGPRTRVVWDIFEKASAAGDELLIHGAGNESRDFIHVEDLAACLVKIATNRSQGDRCAVLNLASGRETPIIELAQMICEIVGSSKRIVVSGSNKPGNPARWQADIHKLMKLNPDFAARDLRLGLEQYRDWFFNLYKKVA